MKVRRIGHASFVTPDVSRQVAYYTEVLGLTLVDRTPDAAYLASTLDHHSVVVRHGEAPLCTHLAFQVAPLSDLGEMQKQIAGHGIKVERMRDAEPTIPDMLVFENPAGTNMQIYCERPASPQKFQEKGVVPVKLGHVAFNVIDVQKVVKFYVDVLGFRVSDWMGDFFAFLRCGPDHHTINLVDSKRMRLNHIAFELRDWAHVQSSYGLPLAQRLPADLGARAAWHRAQHLHVSPRSRWAGGGAVLRTRPHPRRGSRLVRAAALAQGSSADTEGLGQGPDGCEHVGHPAAARLSRLRSNGILWLRQRRHRCRRPFKIGLRNLRRGMLRKRLFVVISKGSGRPEMIASLLPEHLNYMIGLEKAGILFASGPLGAGDSAAVGDGLTILNVDTLEHARTLASIDPFVRAGARSFTVREWTLMEGRMQVTLSFSDKSLALG